MHITFKNKSQTKQSREYKHLSKFRMFNILIIFLIIFVFGVTIWFVYTNIYQTIGKVQTLILIQTNPHFEPINFKLYNNTIEQWNNKKIKQPLDISRDPFYNISIQTTSTTSTSDIKNNNTHIIPKIEL